MVTVCVGLKDAYTPKLDTDILSTRECRSVPIYPSSHLPVPLSISLFSLPPLPPPTSHRPKPAIAKKKEKMEKFFAAKAKASTQADPPRKEGEGEEGQGQEERQGQGNRKPLFPKGVVLGKDGKPYLYPSRPSFEKK